MIVPFPTRTTRQSPEVRYYAPDDPANPLTEVRRAEFQAHAEDCARKIEGRTEAALFDYTVAHVEDTVRDILDEIDPTDPFFLRWLYPELLLWQLVKQAKAIETAEDDEAAGA